MQKRLSGIIGMVLFCFSPLIAAEGPLPLSLSGAHLQMSPDGTHLIVSGPHEEGLFLYHPESARLTMLSSRAGTARNATWSSDGQWIAYKDFISTAEQTRQIPRLHHLTSGAVMDLCAPAEFVGTPSFSANGLLACTSGKTLIVQNVPNGERRTFSLPGYVNLAPISPQGEIVVYNDAADQLWLLHLRTRRTSRLTNDSTGYFAPSWSPDSDAILAMRMDGHVVVIPVPDAKMIDLGEGYHPNWSRDGKKIIFTRVIRSGEYLVDSLAIAIFSLESRKMTSRPLLSPHGESPIFGPHDDIWWIDTEEGSLYQAPGDPSAAWTSNRYFLDSALLEPPLKEAVVNRPGEISAEEDVFDIPYLHQAYDTPDWFNGNWACGGTSAVMCLAYYGILPKWPTYVSSPERHISEFGRYISDIYTYRDYTFNIGGQDPNGKTGYGAYGYIIQNNWADTKGNMASYARRHGLGSTVDWSPQRAEVMQEVNQKLPFVLLNSLTTSGHYISVIGYEKEATTVIVNDPWGDKNRGYPNNYGQRAKYDWPGYNNGHRSLNTVHCFIYFRNTIPDLKPVVTNDTDTTHIAQSFPFSAKIANLGWTASTATKAVVVFSTNTMYNATDIHIGHVEIPAIAAADTFHLTERFTVPDSLTSAMYAVGLSVDAENLIAEVEENNNFSFMRKLVCGRPVISTLKPAAGSNMAGGSPTISVEYFDRVTSIDTRSVQLTVDGEDVTSQSQVGARFITYNPQIPLAEGLHQIEVSLQNSWGYAASRIWSFTVSPAANVSTGAVEAQASSLLQAHPNPFNAATRITFELNRAQKTRLQVFDLAGRCVATLVDDVLQSGRHERIFAGTDDKGVPLPSGVYFSRLETASQRLINRLLLLR